MKEYEKQILAMIFDPRDETKEKILDLFEKHTSIDYKIVSRELGIKKHIASKHLVQLTKRNIIIAKSEVVLGKILRPCPVVMDNISMISLFIKFTIK